MKRENSSKTVTGRTSRMMNKNSHNKKIGSNIDRSDERIDQTGEVFTPMELCHKLVNDIPESILKDPNSTFIDNSAGSGNFIIALQTKLKEYHELSHINDNMLYAVELLEDNHAEMCKRVRVSVDHPHFVCADALKYDYGFGELVGTEALCGKISEIKGEIPKRRSHEPSRAVLPW